MPFLRPVGQDLTGINKAYLRFRFVFSVEGKAVTVLAYRRSRIYVPDGNAPGFLKSPPVLVLGFECSSGCHSKRPRTDNATHQRLCSELKGPFSHLVVFCLE